MESVPMDTEPSSSSSRRAAPPSPSSTARGTGGNGAVHARSSESISPLSHARRNKRHYSSSQLDAAEGAEGGAEDSGRGALHLHSQSNRPKLSNAAVADSSHRHTPTAALACDAEAQAAAHTAADAARVAQLRRDAAAAHSGESVASSDTGSTATSPLDEKGGTAAGIVAPLHPPSGTQPSSASTASPLTSPPSAPSSLATGGSSCGAHAAAMSMSVTPPGRDTDAEADSEPHLAPHEMIDLTTDDESFVSPDVEQREPFYLPVLSQTASMRHARAYLSNGALASQHAVAATAAKPTQAAAKPGPAQHHDFLSVAAEKPRPSSAPPACALDGEEGDAAAAFYAAAAAGGGGPGGSGVPGAGSLAAAQVSPNGGEDWLPCEVAECHFFLAPAEYQSHMLLHHFDLVKAARERAQLLRAQELLARQVDAELNGGAGAGAGAVAGAGMGVGAGAGAGGVPERSPGGHSVSSRQSSQADIGVVPCDHPRCGALVPIGQYAQHQRAHEARAGSRFSVEHGHQRYKPLQSIADAYAYDAQAGLGAAASAYPSSSSSSAAPAAAAGIPSGPGPTSGPGDSHFVSGIIPILHGIFCTRSNVEVYLCNPVQFFFRSRGDGGFGCGYKNIQTLCSALLQFPLFREVLFEGSLRERDAVADLAAKVAAAAAQPVAEAAAAARRNARAEPPQQSASPPPVLLSALQQVPEVLPRMPTISALQRFLDRAHQRGFDVVGAAQVGQLRNSKTWIGAVEAHALLCSYAVRSELIDFKSSYIGLMEYVWNYFTTRTLPVRSASANSSGSSAAAASSPAGPTGASMFNTHARVFQPTPAAGPGSGGPVTSPSASSSAAEANSSRAPRGGAGFGRNGHARGANADDAAAGSASASAASSSGQAGAGLSHASFVPPLYFQHQGHSRTIIGILRNLKSGRFRLLVLDPDINGGGVKLLQNLQRTSAPNVVKQALRTLYRNEDNLKAKEYQMVMVSSYGLMSAEEQERSKRPFSTVISAVEPGGLTSPPPSSGHSPEQAQQQTAQQPEAHHGRGAGGATGPGRDAAASKTRTPRWKLERREVDSKAPARRVGELLKDGEAGGAGGEEPRASSFDDSEDESPESAAIAPTAAQQGLDRREVKVGSTARDEQKRVREANQAVQLAAERNNQRKGLPRGAAGAAAPPGATTSDGFAVPQPYHERRGIPVIPPSRQRLHAAATPLLPPGMAFEPRARSAGATIGAQTEPSSAPSNLAAPASLASRDFSSAAAPASCSRIPQHSRLLQPQPPSKQ